MTDTDSPQTLGQERRRRLAELLAVAPARLSLAAVPAPAPRKVYAYLADQGGDHHPDMWFRVEEVDGLAILDVLPPGHARLVGVPVVSQPPAAEIEMVKPDYLDGASFAEHNEVARKLRARVPRELARLLRMLQTLRGPGGLRLQIMLLSSGPGLVTDSVVNGHTLHTSSCECAEQAETFDPKEYLAARGQSTVEASARRPRAALAPSSPAPPAAPELVPVVAPSWDPLRLSPELWGQVPDYLAESTQAEVLNKERAAAAVSVWNRRLNELGLEAVTALLLIVNVALVVTGTLSVSVFLALLAVMFVVRKQAVSMRSCRVASASKSAAISTPPRRTLCSNCGRADGSGHARVNFAPSMGASVCGSCYRRASGETKTLPGWIL